MIEDGREKVERVGRIWRVGTPSVLYTYEFIRTGSRKSKYEWIMGS